jgi:class 3 adenylate cyclase
LTTAESVRDNRARSEDSANTRQAETRKLAAIMFTDIVGFSRQMEANATRRRACMPGVVSLVGGFAAAQECLDSFPPRP